MPAVHIRSSKESFCLDVNDDERDKTGVQGFRYFWDGQESVTLEIEGVLAHPTSVVFIRTLGGIFQEVGVVCTVVFCPGGIELSEGIEEAPGKAGQLALSLLATCCSCLVGKASLVEFGTEGSGEAPKRGCELDEVIIGGPSMVAKGNQEGRIHL